MFPVDHSTAVPVRPSERPEGAPGWFGVAAPGPTVLDAEWLNRVQAEILSVVTAAGLTPTKSESNQLAQAVAAIAESAAAAQAASLEPEITAGTTGEYWRGDKSWQPLNAAAVGLGDVDNTADSAKPISVATQAALDDRMRLDAPTTFARYDLVDLPDASDPDHVGMLIIVGDANPVPALCYSNGTDWCLINTNTVVS